MKKTRFHAEAGMPNLSDAHSDQKCRTKTSDSSVFSGTIRPQPMDQQFPDTDSADLETTSSATDEDSAASDPESLSPNEEDSESDGQELSFLCSRCRKLDFDSIFSRRHPQVGGDSNFWFQASGDPILWFNSENKVFVDERCSFCQAMRFIHPSLDTLPDWKKRRTPLVVATYQDLAARWAKLPSGDWDVSGDKASLTFGYHPESPGKCNAIFLWTKGNTFRWTPEELTIPTIPEWVGYLAETPTLAAYTEAFPAALIKPRVDFDMIKNILTNCREEHEKCRIRRAVCNQKIPGMRLIDCRTRTVVPVPGGDVSYAALSYVWGESSEGHFENRSTVQDCPHKLPDSLPNTISDAIVVTRKLKIRYLWIDRYCIRQVAQTKEEKNEKHGQIVRMHQIYGGASITIIAAAGKGPEHGLPGVRTKRRPPTVRLPNRTLFATLPNPKLLVDASLWSTRGWTFQEGLLARRLLVFTEQQVYFQCGERGIMEAWREIREDVLFKDCSARMSKPLYPYFTVGSERNLSVWPRISDYVRLTMRDAKDILNGILGVLAYYEGISLMRHIAGLPLYPYPYRPISWPQDLANALSWTCDEPGERRAGFPSWSWTGWTCKGLERNKWPNNIDLDKAREWKVSIEEFTDELSNQTDLVTVLDGEHDLSQVMFLRITAPCLEAEIIPMDGIPKKQRCWVESYAWEGEAFNNNDQLLGVRYSTVDQVYFINLTDSNWLKAPLPCGKISCFAIITDEGCLDVSHSIILMGDLATTLLVIEKEDGFEKIGVSAINREKLGQAGSVVRDFRLK